MYIFRYVILCLAVFTISIILITNQIPIANGFATHGTRPDISLSIVPATINVEQDEITNSNSVLIIDTTIRIPPKAKMIFSPNVKYWDVIGKDINIEVSVDPPGLGVTAIDQQHGYPEVVGLGTLQNYIDGRYRLVDSIYVNVDSYTPPGIYHVNVKVSADLGDGMITKTATLIVNVTPPKTFSASMSPNEVTVAQGSFTTTDVTVTATESHPYGIYLWVRPGSNLYSGLHWRFPNLPSLTSEGPYSRGAFGIPVPAIPGISVTTPLTIIADSSAPLGKHILWVNPHTQVFLPPSDWHSSNMFVPLTVHIVPKSSSSQQSTLSTQLDVSSSTTLSSFTYYMGSSPCPFFVTSTVLESNEPYGNWTATSAPTWASVTFGKNNNNENEAMIFFNCKNLDASQILNGSVTFTFTSFDGRKASADVSIHGKIITPSQNSSNTLQENQMIPNWIKNSAKWWSQGQTTDHDYLSSVGWLVSNGVINLQSKGSKDSTIIISDNIHVPSWIKNDATWWATGSIDDSTYLQSLQYMLDNNIITFSTHATTNSNTAPQLHQVVIHLYDHETGKSVGGLVTIGGGATYMEKETERDGSLTISLPIGIYTVTADANEYQRSIVKFEITQSSVPLINVSVDLKTFKPTSTTQEQTPTNTSTTQTPLMVSISSTSTTFTHNIGTSTCPTPITTVTLTSNEQGSWELTSAPDWTSVTLNGNQASISFNCQLESHTTQILNDSVTFTFTSLNGQKSSTSISITGHIHGQS